MVLAIDPASRSDLSSAELQARKTDAISRGVASRAGFFISHADGAEIWDVEGRRYIDFGSGISTLNLGHRHPGVRNAIQGQLDRHLHTCFHVGAYATLIELAERLNALAPIDGKCKSAFFCTGTEANENAIKFARAHTRRPGAIAFTGGYHGRTYLALSLTGKTKAIKKDLGPFFPSIHHLPFPSRYHGIDTNQVIEALDRLFESSIPADQVAAIIVEPVQGNGGIEVAPPDFLRALRERCDKHGIVLIIDEVQTAFGRTGTMFAIEQSGVQPDLITVAKSLGGGLPLSAVLGKAEIMDAVAPGAIGSTAGGNPVASAAAIAVLDAIEQEKLADRAKEIGQRITRRIEALRSAGNARIGDIRGLGAMIGIEFVKNGNPAEYDSAFVEALLRTAHASGLLILACGLKENVVRLLPPLTISDALLEEGLELLVRTIETCAA